MTPKKFKKLILFTDPKWPDKISVAGDLDLYGYTSLTHLPDGLSIVAGSLDLGECTGLTHLPEGLSVTGDLNLYGCTSLTHLPTGLSVNGNLFLEGCTGLTHIPPGLPMVGGLFWGILPQKLRIRSRHQKKINVIKKTRFQILKET